MTMAITTTSPEANLSTRTTVPRQTPTKTASFEKALETTGRVVLTAVSSLSPLVPAPAHLAASVRSSGSSISGATASLADPRSPGGGSASSGDESLNEAWAMQQESQAFNVEYLKLQEAIQSQNRQFTCLSNVMKARHETMKSAIGNLR